MTDKEKPKSLSELIASTPAAQPLDVALENIRARRRRLLDGASKPALDAAIEPEPIPVFDNPEEFASDFWARQTEKKKTVQKPKAPKGKPTKAPHLTVHDGDEPPKKK